MPTYPDTTRAQLEALTVAAETDDGPVVMLNLLRFKEDGGSEAYARYGQKVVPLVEELGGQVVFQGACAEAVIGPTEREWDAVLLVRYPSRRAFLDMIASPEYGDAHPLRVEAIADSRLIPCADG